MYGIYYYCSAWQIPSLYCSVLVVASRRVFFISGLYLPLPPSPFSQSLIKDKKFPHPSFYNFPPKCRGHVPLFQYALLNLIFFKVNSIPQTKVEQILIKDANSD